MKKMILIIVVCSLAAEVMAQKTKITPAYWVVETNVNQKNYSIVRLYDSCDNLVHEVRMDDMYFDVLRPRHQKMLNQLLRGAYVQAEVTARRIRKSSLVSFSSRPFIKDNHKTH
jgi:hypothetical protein